MVTQSNAKFNALDTLISTVDSVRMPAGFGGGGDGRALKTRGRPLSVMAHLKLSIVVVVTGKLCRAHRNNRGSQTDERPRLHGV
jgi:hypothetical protein